MLSFSLLTSLSFLSLFYSRSPSRRSRVGRGVTIRDSMLMGSDYYESESLRQSLLAEGKVPIGIGDGSLIQNTIVSLLLLAAVLAF